MTHASANNILTSRYWYVFALSVIVIYLTSAALLTDQTPKFDDLNDVFGFFKQLALAQTVPQKLGAFFYPNNEHITAFSHFVYFLQYSALGEIHFYSLTLFGHLIIVATGCLLGSAINSERKPFYFAVCTLGYINLYFWDSSFKAMTAISNQAVILFILATFFLLLRTQKLFPALCCAILASFSQSNGLLVWPIGALLLVCCPIFSRYRWRDLSVWLLIAIAVFVLYAWAKRSYGTPSPLTLAYVQTHWQNTMLWNIAAATMAFPASTIFSTAHTGLTIAFGALLWLCALVWLLGLRQRNWLVSALVLFVLLSALSAGLMRGFFAGAEGALESRYKMYSFALVLLLGAAGVEYGLRPRWRHPAAALLLLLALTFQVSAYRVVPFIQSQAERFHLSYQHWMEDGDFRRQAIYFPPMSDHFLFVAHYLQLFNFMQFVPQEAILRRLPAVPGQACPTVPAPANPCSIAIRHRGNAIVVAIDAGSTPPVLPATVTLCDTQTDAVVEIAIPESPMAPHTWLIPEADIPAGHYRVLFQPTQQAACETTLIKKPRKAYAEMRTLFGDRPVDPG